MTNAVVRWCDPCDVGFTSPMPLVDYSSYTDEARDFERWVAFGEAVVRWAVLLRARLPLSWLDFGAGSGELVIAAQRAGIEAVGVDLDNGARTLARERGAVVVQSLDLLPTGAVYDVITASHVLEHLVDPVATLRELSLRLAHGGTLVVVQPNPGGLSPRLLPSRWKGWIPTQHLWHWTPASLADTAALAGLEVVAVNKTSLAYQVTTLRSLAAATVAKVGDLVGQGDAFYIALQPRVPNLGAGGSAPALP